MELDPLKSRAESAYWYNWKRVTQVGFVFYEEGGSSTLSNEL